MHVRSIALLTLLAACGAGQYVAIPGAWVDTDDAVNATQGTDQSPSLVITQGSSDLAIGQSVVYNVTFSSVTEITVEQLAFFIAPIPDVWIYELTEEQIAAGSVDIEIQATDTKPTEPSCTVETRYGQHGWCASPAESGATEAVAWAQNDTTTSRGTPFPLTLAPVDEGTPDACSAFTAADCCPGGGIYSCAIDPSCKCPDGTGDGGIGGDGNQMCTCPAS